MTIAILLVAALLQVQTVPAARISKVEGGVELNGSAVVPRVGDSILAGDRLHTLKGASLTLALGSDLILQLRSDTKLEMKDIKGELVALLTEGSVSVRSSGKPARIETKYGQIIGTEAFQEFEVGYSGEIVQVLLVGGGVRAEVSDSSKVVFKNAYDFGQRVYEAGSISPTSPREPRDTTVIVYPRVVNPASSGKRNFIIDEPVPPK